MIRFDWNALDLHYRRKTLSYIPHIDIWFLPTNVMKRASIVHEQELQERRPALDPREYNHRRCACATPEAAWELTKQ